MGKKRLGELLVARCGYTPTATCRASRKMVSPERKFCPYCGQDFLKSAFRSSLA